MREGSLPKFCFWLWWTLLKTFLYLIHLWNVGYSFHWFVTLSNSNNLLILWAHHLYHLAVPNHRPFYTPLDIEKAKKNWILWVWKKRWQWKSSAIDTPSMNSPVWWKQGLYNDILTKSWPMFDVMHLMGILLKWWSLNMKLEHTIHLVYDTLWKTTCFSKRTFTFALETTWLERKKKEQEVVIKLRMVVIKNMW